MDYIPVRVQSTYNLINTDLRILTMSTKRPSQQGKLNKGSKPGEFGNTSYGNHNPLTTQTKHLRNKQSQNKNFKSNSVRKTGHR